jgi:hypothetical protein
MIAAVYKEDMAVAIGSEFIYILVGCMTQLSYFTVTYLFRTTGQVLGVSLSGTVLQAVLLRKLRERIRGSEAHKVRIIMNLTLMLTGVVSLFIDY